MDVRRCPARGGCIGWKPSALIVAQPPTDLQRCYTQLVVLLLLQQIVSFLRLQSELQCSSIRATPSMKLRPATKKAMCLLLCACWLNHRSGHWPVQLKHLRHQTIGLGCPLHPTSNALSPSKTIENCHRSCYQHLCYLEPSQHGCEVPEAQQFDEFEQLTTEFVKPFYFLLKYSPGNLTANLD